MSCSVLIFTLNEALHLPSCLKSVEWCDDVVVVDSFSIDETESICREHGVRFIQNAFTGFGSQRNWALDHVDLKYDWVLVLDADERVSSELATELVAVAKGGGEGHAAYQLRRRFHMWGRWLRYSSMYPTWVMRFFNKRLVRYQDRGHAETQLVEGTIGDLSNDLIDENLKGIDEWFERQNRYSRQEAEYELDNTVNGSVWSLFSTQPLQRRAAVKQLVRSLPFRGAVYFIYAYVVRGGFLDGKEGLAFCRMRSLYYAMIELKRFDLSRRGRSRSQ